MFDKYEIGPREVTVKKDVHEHRAPTDESVALLRDMEKKARREVLVAYVVQDNLLSGAVVQFVPNEFACDTEVHVTFTLNGKQYEFSNYITRMDETRLSKTELRAQLVYKLAETIAIELLGR